jgi:hypothetical protein
VDSRLIIALKAAKALADEHLAQILGYLRSSRVEHGLLINFGAPEFEIKKYALSRIGKLASCEDLTQRHSAAKPQPKMAEHRALG